MDMVSQMSPHRDPCMPTSMFAIQPHHYIGYNLGGQRDDESEI